MALPRGTRRLHAICGHLAIGTFIWGYNVGVLSSVLVHPGWRASLHDPSPSRKGLITGIYYLGALFSYLLISHPVADVFGRKYAAMYGTVVLCMGAVLMASAASLPAMLFGRALCGVGAGVVSTSVPLEVSPAKQRGKFVTMNHVGFVAGLAAGLWVGYAMTFWTSDQGVFWGWRVSLVLQFIPATVFLAGLPFLPDTPRWLVQTGKAVEASHTLHYLRQDAYPRYVIDRELLAIHIHEPRKQISASAASSLVRDASLRARLWRAFLLQFMAQMCGATAIKYYLPTLLEALGLDTRLALMAGAVEMTLKIAMVVVEMYFIDRFGRKKCLVGGSVVMGVAMLINGLLPLVFPGNTNKVADGICIVFIFVYAMGYSLGLGPATWVYSAEVSDETEPPPRRRKIFPTSLRARGLNFSAAGGAIGSMLVSQIWPVGNAHFGSGVYFFFMAVNIICVPTIWYLYPETKGRALEAMDHLFISPPNNNNNGEETSDDSDDDGGDEEVLQITSLDDETEWQPHNWQPQEWQPDEQHPPDDWESHDLLPDDWQPDEWDNDEPQDADQWLRRGQQQPHESQPYETDPLLAPTSPQQGAQSSQVCDLGW
ncbi:General substrate transporter [Moelleriella libera RCEF 2490]|uniref:General substrate transporter n=1 Tax=Moelleriella libera RCEF 2490 TaxID=1081109 RepID=A0A162IM25_9HYPO|nr:General substrate transporter [Moelleriella libera RCEF 2490]